MYSKSFVRCIISVASNQNISNQIKLMEISENKAISQANVCDDDSRKLMAHAWFL